MQSKMKGLGAGGYFVVCPSPKAPSKPRDQAEAAEVPFQQNKALPWCTARIQLPPQGPATQAEIQGWISAQGCAWKAHFSNIFLTFCVQTFIFMEMYIFLIDRAERPAFVSLPSKASGGPKKASRMDVCNHWTSPVLILCHSISLISKLSPLLSSPTQGDVIVSLLWAGAVVSVHHQGGNGQKSVYSARITKLSMMKLESSVKLFAECVWFKNKVSIKSWGGRAALPFLIFIINLGSDEDWMDKAITGKLQSSRKQGKKTNYSKNSCHF